MKRGMVSLLRIVSGLCLASTVSYGAVQFIASDETAELSSPVTVPITVSGFADVTTFQFTLQWDPDVIQFSSVSGFGLAYLTAGSFGTLGTATGTLTVSWDDLDLTGKTLSAGSKIFDVNFTSASSVGSTSVLFTGDPTPREVSVNFVSDVFIPVDGSVIVVPEPVNVAFAFFGCIFVGTMTIRWIRSNRLFRATA